MHNIVELDLQDFIYEDPKQTPMIWKWKWWTMLRRKDSKISNFDEQETDSSNWIQRNGLLISVTLGYVVAGFGFTMLGSLLPFLGERYSTSENDEGMLFLFFYIFGLLFGEIGVLAMVVRFRRQRANNPTPSMPDDNMRCYLFGLKCSAVALVLLWICTMAPIGYGLFVVCSIIFGFFLSFIDVSTNAMLSHNSETSAFALNLLYFGFGVGSFSAPFIFDSVGASNTFLVFGLFASIVFLFSMGVTQYIQRTQSEAIPMHDQMEASDDPPSHDVAIDDTSLWHDLRDLMKRFQYWLIISAVLFYAGAELVVGGWIASMFIEMGMEQYSSTATILYWLGIMGSRVLFSGYCHVFVPVGTLGTLGLLRKYLGWSILMPSCLILLSPAVPAEISLIFTCLIGVSFAPILPLLISVCGTMFGSHGASASDSNAHAHANANANGTLMSIIGILFFSNMGSGILPMVTGLVAQRLSIRLAMWIGVACAVMVNIIVNLLTFLYKRQETRRVAASSISA